METASSFCSLRGTLGMISRVGSTVDRGIVPQCNVSSKRLFTFGVIAGGSFILSPVERKKPFHSHFKVSETSLAVTSGSDVSPKNSSQETLETKHQQGTRIPSAFEALVLEVCDETDVAELKVKIGDFEMHMKRNIGAKAAPAPSVQSPSTPPDVPSKPMIESISATPAALPQKSAPASTNPFTNVSLAKSSKLSALEGSGTNSYVIISSPTVGSFRRGRTVKGRKQSPICKEGAIIKRGQVIGYLDQFGNELPVKSDVAGEVLKLLFKDGEAVGYGDPLVAVLPAFPGIQ